MFSAPLMLAGVAPSLASQLLSGANGVAVAFNDNYFHSTTGFYGSMRVNDSTTPGNNYNNSPRSSSAVTKIVNTGSSLKLVRQADGFLDFAPHNLALRSEDVGNSNWAKVGTANNPSGNVTAATKANPCVVTFSAAHPFVNGQTISFSSVGGMTQLNGNVYTVANATSTTVELSGVDSTGFGTYTSGGVGSAATVLNLPAINDRIQAFATASNCVGRTNIFSAVMSGTGTLTLQIYENGAGTTQQITLTSTPTRYSISRNVGETSTDIRLWVQRVSGDTATSVTITNFQHEVSFSRTTPGPYIKTTSAIVYTLPFEWDTSGNLIGARFEEARTNLCLRNCDLTNAVWTATNMTTARTATGPNNRANFATTLTATAGNATVLQSITSASANRRTGCWIKRRTGSGNIDLTQDNGATWTTVTVTSDWTLVQTANATLTNPVVGIRIVTSGDAVDVAFFQHETLANIDAITSPIYTVAASVTRAVDNFQTAIADVMTLGTECTLYAHFIALQTLKLPSGQRCAVSVGATSTNSIGVGLRSSGIDDLFANVNSGGASTANWNEGTISLSTGDKVAIAVAANDAEAVVDGVSMGAVDNSTGIPSGATPTHLIYGGDGTSVATPLTGWLVAVMARPARMSQAAMITLTT